MKPTHIYEFSDGTTVSMGPGTPPRFVTHPLTRLDGGTNNHIILSRLTREEWVDDLSEQERDESLSSFLQAGGSAEAMMLELRRREADGSYRQYVLGSGETKVSTDPDVNIRVGEHTYLVAPNEVFTAEAAGEVFVHYFHHDEAPRGLSLRELVR
ncbi:hypothetical protein VX037_20395 [Gordonia sp. Z-3]|jgi:hypothetical protein|uniref:hypothetical protein n=1 Tax=Gordonia sp. Z-3 TaxID=3115408 RepID=UPI002E284A6D|nr:hypothetical protein [Gordonia sp. Z-3]MED5803389.1 hypothetical protein [Gordonia sp. Z-3]